MWANFYAVTGNPALKFTNVGFDLSKWRGRRRRRRGGFFCVRACLCTPHAALRFFPPFFSLSLPTRTKPLLAHDANQQKKDMRPPCTMMPPHYHTYATETLISTGPDSSTYVIMVAEDASKAFFLKFRPYASTSPSRPPGRTPSSTSGALFFLFVGLYVFFCVRARAFFSSLHQPKHTHTHTQTLLAPLPSSTSS